MDANDLRHAYAVLRLSSPVTEAQLKRRYKALVKRWHPDRYHTDPAGQAEAAERLRDINIAYELVAASLKSGESSQVMLPSDVTDRPFTLSHDRIDAIVESINQANRISLLPEMSVQRWLSIGAIVLYFVAASFVIPAGQWRREIVKAMSEASAYFWLPLYAIWTADKETRSNLESRLYQFLGWLLMALPAIIEIALLMAG